jgi:hypothetical protein
VRTSRESRATVIEDRPMLAEPRGALQGTGDLRHERALIHARAVRLAHGIRPFGVLHKDVLAHVAGAEHWPGGAFQLALDAAVEQGLLQRAALGFYQAAI